MKKLLALPILFLVMISVAYASNFHISKFTIYINGEDQGTLKNNSVYSETIEPGDKVEFEIELENTFKNDTDINNIKINGAIYNISEGNDLFDNITTFDLAQDSTKTKKLRFDIPTDADELQKEVIINVKGIDDEKNSYNIGWYAYLNIEDESHDIFIQNTKIDNSISACNGTGNIILFLTNKGDFDESSVTLKVENKDLGIEKVYTNINIDKDGTYTKIVPISIKNPKTGVFSIEIKAYYKDTHLDDVKTVNITIEHCKLINANNSVNNSNKEVLVKNEENNNIQIISNQIEPNDNTKQDDQNNIVPSAYENKDRNVVPIYLIFLIILIILIAIVIITMFIIRREQ